MQDIGHAHCAHEVSTLLRYEAAPLSNWFQGCRNCIMVLLSSVEMTAKSEVKCQVFLTRCHCRLSIVIIEIYSLSRVSYYKL